MKTDLFDFHLPDDRIALTPAEPRGSARLLLVQGGAPEALQNRTIGDLAAILKPGDALVFNNTRVIAAALEGVRIRGELSSKVSFNLLRRQDERRWRALARPAKRLQLGDEVVFGAAPDGLPLSAQVAAKLDAGEVELSFDRRGEALDQAIEAVGRMPLPPYIAGKRAPDERDRAAYQTVFAHAPGAVAAPTAGLHFTEGLLAQLAAQGISQHFVTLHVGAGTFLPVKVEDTANHVMHAEWGEVTEATAQALRDVRHRGGRVVAVGTTSLRLLESAAVGGDIAPFQGETAIFISPGYQFRAVDLLLTNFHLPRSTLFMLVSAFSGLETMHAAYAHAIAHGYRFYSYGDACLLFPNADSAPPPLVKF